MLQCEQLAQDPLQFGCLLIQRCLNSLPVFRRDGNFTGKAVLSGYDEVQVVFLLIHQAQRILLCPLFLKLLGIQDMEVERNAGGGKRFQPGFVKGSPNPGFFYFLLQLLEAAGYLSVGHERSVGKPEQVIRTLTRVGDRFRPFGDVHLLQPFDQAVDAFDFPGDSHSYFVHGLFAPRNIYQTDLLKLLQEGGLFSIQQNEGIAGHFIDHSSSSSSSAA